MHLFWIPLFSKNNSFAELKFSYHTMPALRVCNLVFSVSSRSCSHRRRRRYDTFFTSILFSILLSLTTGHPLCPWMSQSGRVSHVDSHTVGPFVSGSLPERRALRVRLPGSACVGALLLSVAEGCSHMWGTRRVCVSPRLMDPGLFPPLGCCESCCWERVWVQVDLFLSIWVPAMRCHSCPVLALCVGEPASSLAHLGLPEVHGQGWAHQMPPPHAG